MLVLASPRPQADNVQKSPIALPIDKRRRAKGVVITLTGY